MPLLKFHILEGWTGERIEALLDAAHDAMVESFGVPVRDRYQLLIQHDPSHVRILDTGLDIHRSEQVVLVEVVSRPRHRDAKLAFYRNLCSSLETRCGIGGNDVIVSFSENTDEDWSFGFGKAQFLTGEL